VAHKGSLFHHETIRSLWIKAAKALQNANRVFVCGYSLPLSDELIRFFLLTNARSIPIELYLVDTRDTANHFNERLGSKYRIRTRFANISEPIPTLVDALKSGEVDAEVDDA